MMKKVAVFIAAAAMSIASAAQTHKIVLFQDSWVNGTRLKPGEYKITVDGDKAVIGRGKNRAESKISVENADNPYGSTAIRYENGDGKYRVKEIRIGGTNTRLVFHGGESSE